MAGRRLTERSLGLPWIHKYDRVEFIRNTHIHSEMADNVPHATQEIRKFEHPQVPTFAEFFEQHLLPNLCTILNQRAPHHNQICYRADFDLVMDNPGPIRVVDGTQIGRHYRTVLSECHTRSKRSIRCLFGSRAPWRVRGHISLTLTHKVPRTDNVNPEIPVEIRDLYERPHP